MRRKRGQWRLKGSENYADWKFRMQMVSIKVDLWDLITGEDQRPLGEEVDENDASVTAAVRTRLASGRRGI